MPWAPNRRIAAIFCATLAAGICSSKPLQAQILLKPHGQYAAPLRLKAMTADAAITGSFADTRLTLTFQNATSRRVEADFIYGLPPDTLATYFAYWYGKEKVVARIVEKERAAAIYSAITSQMRDPALVEMIGRNTFRARIFPVMPNSDLKVEMRLVQVLPSDRGGVSYALPVRRESSETLDSCQINVSVKANSSIASVENNLGLPVAANPDGYRLSLSTTNYRLQQEMRVHVTRKPEPLQTELYSAPSGGSDGFFALTLSPNHSLTKPNVRIQGLQTYQVLPLRIPDVQAYGTLILFGRYRGHGPATVILTGKSRDGLGLLKYTKDVVFGAKPQENNLASKLWAARRIEQMSVHSRDREAVIRISERYTLPSKFTSWLAMPRDEMARHKREAIYAEIQVVAQQLASELTHNRGSQSYAQRLKRKLDDLCRTVDWNGQQILNGELQDSMRALASRIVAAEHRGRKMPEERWTLARLAKLTGTSATDFIRNVNRSWAREMIRKLVDQFAELIMSGRGDTPKARKTHDRLLQVYRLFATNAQSEIQSMLSAYTERLAREYVQEEHRDKPDQAKLSNLRLKMERLDSQARQTTAVILQRHEYYWRHGEIERLRNLILSERRSPSPNTVRSQMLEDRFLEMYRLNQDESMGKTRLERLVVRTDIESLDKLIESSPSEVRPELAKRREALVRRSEELRARMGDPLISVEAPADAQQVVALMPNGEIKPLEYNRDSGKWEARFDIPAYSSEGEYEITIVIVLSDGLRKSITMRYRVDLTPPTGSGQARIVQSTGPDLRLETTASEDTARVEALLPWGDRISLRAMNPPNYFFALAPVPANYRGESRSVTFILTDRAHNQTSVTVDVKE